MQPMTSSLSHHSLSVWLQHSQNMDSSGCEGRGEMPLTTRAHSLGCLAEVQCCGYKYGSRIFLCRQCSEQLLTLQSQLSQSSSSSYHSCTTNLGSVGVNGQCPSVIIQMPDDDEDDGDVPADYDYGLEDEWKPLQNGMQRMDIEEGGGEGEVKSDSLCEKLWRHRRLVAGVGVGFGLGALFTYAALSGAGSVDTAPKPTSSPSPEDSTTPKPDATTAGSSTKALTTEQETTTATTTLESTSTATTPESTSTTTTPEPTSTTTIQEPTAAATTTLKPTTTTMTQKPTPTTPKPTTTTPKPTTTTPKLTPPKLTTPKPTTTTLKPTTTTTTTLKPRRPVRPTRTITVCLKNTLVFDTASLHTRIVDTQGNTMQASYREANTITMGGMACTRMTQVPKDIYRVQAGLWVGYEQVDSPIIFTNQELKQNGNKGCIQIWANPSIGNLSGYKYGKQATDVCFPPRRRGK